MARKKRESSKATKKTKVEAVEAPPVVVDEGPVPPKSLHGELFWEYRAKTSEYERALMELEFASKELKTELSDPKYKRILELLAKEDTLKNQLKEQASFLRGVQVKVATNLGMSIETFLKECLIDHDTGVVKLID